MWWKYAVMFLTIVLTGIAMLFLQFFEIDSAKSYILTGIVAIMFLSSLFIINYFLEPKTRNAVNGRHLSKSP